MFPRKRLTHLRSATIVSLSLLYVGPLRTAAQVSVPMQPAATPPAEAFRVLAQPSSEKPEITPYLLYQTSIAWQQDELRQARWSQVKTEADLLKLRSELRASVLEMIGGLPDREDRPEGHSYRSASGKRFSHREAHLPESARVCM